MAYALHTYFALAQLTSRAVPVAGDRDGDRFVFCIRACTRGLAAALIGLDINRSNTSLTRACVQDDEDRYVCGSEHPNRKPLRTRGRRGLLRAYHDRIKNTRAPHSHTACVD